MHSPYIWQISCWKWIYIDGIFFLKNNFGKKTYNVILSRFPGSNSWSYCLNMYGEQITMNIYDAMRFVIKAKPAVLGKPEIGQLDHFTKSNVRGNRGA